MLRLKFINNKQVIVHGKSKKKKCLDHNNRNKSNYNNPVINYDPN